MNPLFTAGLITLGVAIYVFMWIYTAVWIWRWSTSDVLERTGRPMSQKDRRAESIMDMVAGFFWLLFWPSRFIMLIGQSVPNIIGPIFDKIGASIEKLVDR